MTDIVQPNELRAQQSATLVRRLFADIQTLALQEAQFARAELEQKAPVVAAAARAGALAFGVGLVAIACASFAVIVLLALYVALWVAALIVAVVLGIVAYLLLQGAKSAAKSLTSLRAPALVFGKQKATTASLDDQAMRIGSTRKRVEDVFSALERKQDLLTPLRNTAAGVGALTVAVASILRHSDNAANGRNG